MKQEITVSDLRKIGFKRKVVKYKDAYGESKKYTIYEIKGLVNDKVYFDQKEPVYTFYYETTVGKAKNSVHLLINSIPVLMLMLQAFQIPNDFFKEKS